MPRTDWSLQDAKNSFSSVVAAAQKGVPQTVSKRGRPAVVVLSVEEYRRLRGQGAGAAPSFVDMLLAMPQDDGAFEHVVGLNRPDCQATTPTLLRENSPSP